MALPHVYSSYQIIFLTIVYSKQPELMKGGAVMRFQYF